MQNPQVQKDSYYYYYYIYFAISILLWLGYFYFTFTSPVDPENRLGLTDPLKIRLVQVSLAVPIMLIWAFGAFAINGFRKYLSLIRGTVEAIGLNKIAIGIAILLFGFAFNAFVGSIRGHYNSINYYHDVLGLINGDTTRLDVLRGFSILTNYLSVLWTIIPYTFMFLGAWILVKSNRIIADLKNRLFFPTFALIMIVMVYLQLFFQNPIRQVALHPEAGQLPTYFFPDNIIILTIVIPYIIAWGLGIMAALAIDVYKDRVTGSIYKEALSKFSVGFLTIVSTSILFQIVATMGNSFFSWSLIAILILVYVLVAALGVGYVLFALGVKKLKKIETV